MRREGREREKNKEEKRERGGQRVPSLSPLPHPLGVFFLLLLPASLCGVPTIRTPGTDYFADPRNTVLWIKCGQLYSSIYVSKVLLQSLRNSTLASAMIITGTPFTLSIFHNSHSRSKNINSVSLCCFSFTVISSECDTRITLTAQAKGIGAAGNENYNFFFVFFIINNFFFLLMRSAFRCCVSGNLSLEVSALRQWLPIRAHKSFHRCVLCSNFRRPFSTSLFFFAFWLLPFLYCGGAT